MKIASLVTTRLVTCNKDEDYNCNQRQQPGAIIRTNTIITVEVAILPSSAGLVKQAGRQQGGAK
jgi:hypothetical protein